MKNDELHFLFSLMVGFVAFSLPLAMHDIGLLPGFTASDGGYDGDALPPAPPPWNYGTGYEENDEATKFRHAVTEGDVAEAARLHAEGLSKPEPEDLVTKEHWHGSTVLFEAARSGHIEMVKWLVGKGADINHANEWGESAANEAATMGHWDVVWYLNDTGADLSRTPTNSHSTLVLSAVRHRSVDALKQLHKRGVDLKHKQWNSATALHEAARTGEAEMVEWLIAQEGGALLNMTNDSGETALHEASAMGHTDLVWRLIRAGIALGEPGSNSADSLMFSAIQHANLELLKHLLDKGVIQIVGRDHYGRVPCIEAVRANSLPTLDWLLQHGANASETSNSEEAPLAVAASDDHFDMVWRLHEHGASLFVTNEHGGTPLHSACHHGHEDEAARLIEKGLDVNAANHRGDTPLSLAASRGDLPLIEMLIAKGADAAPKGERRDTPLIRASKFRRVDAARRLIEKFGDVNHANRKGDTALIEACRAGSLGMAELLLEHGASVEAQNRAGMTPLLEAAESGALEVVKLLQAKGASVHAVNKVGDGALELSRYARRSDELKEFFTSHGVEVKREDPYASDSGSHLEDSELPPDHDDH